MKEVKYTQGNRLKRKSMLRVKIGINLQNDESEMYPLKNVTHPIQVSVGNYEDNLRNISLINNDINHWNDNLSKETDLLDLFSLYRSETIY